MNNRKRKQPLVSVIMPIRNGRRFMREAIESILRQTYTNFELLLIDDASDDASWNIIKSYKSLYPNKVKAIKLKKRRGAFGALNIALRQAKGEFIAPMDSDDIAHPQRVEREVEYLLSHKDTIVVGSYARLINEKGEIIGKKAFPTNHKEIYQAFAEVHAIVHPSCMVRREMLPDRNRLYVDIYGVNDDYYTFFTLFNYGKFANIPEYLLQYRIHGNNSSLQNLKGKFFNTVKIRLHAVRKHGYNPTKYSIVKVAAQVLIMLFIPGAVAYPLYLLAKGVYTPKPLIKKAVYPFYRLALASSYGNKNV